MKKNIYLALVIFAGALCAAVPVWFSYHEAQRQALEVESLLASGYAADVLTRADAMANQVDLGFTRLEKVHAAAPCSQPAQQLMKQIDLTSSYIQAIGYAKDGFIACSSIAEEPTAMAIPPPDYTTRTGVHVRKNLILPFAPGHSFFSLERNHFIAILHKDLPISPTVHESGVSLAVFSLADTTPLTSRGHIDPRWLTRLGNRADLTFSDATHVVALRRSQRYYMVTVAAVPITHLEAQTAKFARRLVPAGILIAALLIACLAFLARRQMSIDAAIKAGLKRGEFYVVYQPVVNLQTGDWAGAEALVRWRRPTGEQVGPDTFIPLAEQNGLITLITQCVLDTVARETGPYLRAHPAFHVAVNLSAQDLHSPALGPQLNRFVSDSGARPDNLILELTERGLLDVKIAQRVTDELRAQGFAVAIDDFGTGYSSLSYLQSLSVDYLKIDKSFIDAIAAEAAVSGVVEHIIELAKTLKLRLVAEGVETDTQRSFLQAHGVHYAQGWLFAKPMPFAELAARRPAPAAPGAPVQAARA